MTARDFRVGTRERKLRGRRNEEESAEFRVLRLPGGGPVVPCKCWPSTWCSFLMQGCEGTYHGKVS